MKAIWHAVSTARGEKSSLPLPIDGHRISIARGHDAAARLDRVSLSERDWNGQLLTPIDGEANDNEGWTLRNSWWSNRLRTQLLMAWHGKPGDADFEIELLEEERFAAQLEPERRWKRQVATFDAGWKAWTLEAELRALELLRSLVKEHQMTYYLLHGMFPESSPRSGACYWFRRGRPTVVLLTSEGGNLTAKTALCLHPLAYYEDTFAGGMVPTDDVIAHLLLMRADEHRYWRLANQHPIDRPQAGI